MAGSPEDEEPRQHGADAHSHEKHTTLLKTPDGRLAYPNYVPPPVHAPDESTTPRACLEKSQSGPSHQQHHEPTSPLSTQSTQCVDGTLSDGGTEAPCDSAEPAQAPRRQQDSPPDPAQKPSKGAKSKQQGARDSGGKDRFGDDFSVGNANYQTTGKIRKDGRLRITIDEIAHKGYIAKALGAATQRMLPRDHEDDEKTQNGEQGHGAKDDMPPAAGFQIPPNLDPQPRLNIVIMVIGSRGDAQPFLRIGKILKEEYGHRVRIATHPAFRDFVEKDSGLEFFSVGGDPSELMAFMVKNPGMIPSLETVKAGEIGRRRDAMAEMFEGFWRSCIHPSDDMKSKDVKSMDKLEPFVADAIIANPPSFAHIHCAEALGVPLHLVFTMPYTPTHAFPHPLASIKQSNRDMGYTNFISYPLVEMMVWQGLGDLVNDFRIKTLGLDVVSTLWAPGATFRLHVPFTYLWSPSLVPKPKDWGPEINVSGFVFLDLASSFNPPQELEGFLNAGEPPVYIGFGSIVVDDADRFTKMIFDAVRKSGIRALVSKGWGGLGGGEIPDNVFMLDNTPHDWLFPRVKAAVIHGGAGTTAIALKCGLPTMIVPFFGDQHFWGSMVATAGAGPKPVPYKYLDVDKLVDGIKYCLTDEAKEAAETIAASIERDGDGAQNAVNSFHNHLKLRGPRSMRCSILRDRIAAWQLKYSHVRLCPLAAEILVASGQLSWKRLRLMRHADWNDFEGPGEPVTGIAGSITGTLKGVFGGIGGMPVRLGKTATKRVRVRHSKYQKNKQLQNEKLHPEEASIGRSSEDAAKDQEHIKGPGPEKYLCDVKRSVCQASLALVKAPAGLFLALAQGFHNAPRLYGDDTVRRPMRITGIRSGLKASRKELTHGVYDAVTGVVRLPVRGAKTGGVTGFAKGVGMGMGGLVLKSTSAVIGPIGYTSQGLVKQAERQRHRGPRLSIRRARICQGQRDRQDLRTSPDCARIEEEVLVGWRVFKMLKRLALNQNKQRGVTHHFDRIVSDAAAMFEDVDVARDCLAQLQAGKSLGDVVGECKRKSRDGTKAPV
ncbi:hypothetical protein HIM_03380 [Hirsutella minnesotensis 3608]|uniref:Uncharacterized protein n=1 Tax=Hirsutella minnesotensis 3608 TaxID=1043627 RepID=A0A0F8A6G9_9HYPO|nr:hypothetical protein HIM_03380 [Hirsutella minnesotensis 3608]